MYTLSFIKISANNLDMYDIVEGKAYANDNRNYSMWWAFDCIENYQVFRRSLDKIFWWRMVVKTLRYANDYARRRRS